MSCKKSCQPKPPPPPPPQPLTYTILDYSPEDDPEPPPPPLTLDEDISSHCSIKAPVGIPLRELTELEAKINPQAMNIIQQPRMKPVYSCRGCRMKIVDDKCSMGSAVNEASDECDVSEESDEEDEEDQCTVEETCDEPSEDDESSEECDEESEEDQCEEEPEEDQCDEESDEEPDDDQECDEPPEQIAGYQQKQYSGVRRPQSAYEQPAARPVSRPRPATVGRIGGASRPATVGRTGSASRPATVGRTGSASRPGTVGRTTSVSSTIHQLINSSPVVIISATYCPYCDVAKDIFNSVGVKYNKIEVNKMPDNKEIMSALKRISGITSVPQIFIQGEFFGGASDLKKLKNSGQLREFLKSKGV